MKRIRNAVLNTRLPHEDLIESVDKQDKEFFGSPAVNIAAEGRYTIHNKRIRQYMISL